MRCFLTAALLFPVVLLGQITVLQDSDFALASWTATKVTDTTPGAVSTFVVEQRQGGMPGAFRFLRQNFGVGFMRVAHARTGAVYDPRRSGAIASIDYSFDGNLLGPIPTRAVAYSILLVQNGTHYETTNHIVTGGGWTRYTGRNLIAADFARVAGTGPQTPDFSATGAPIQFGYLTANSSATVAGFTDSGIDNLSISVASFTQFPGANCLHFPPIAPLFESIYYLSQPNAAGDRLLVGRLGASAAAIQQKLRDLNLVPLPNSFNTAFCSPVELAPGQFFDAYVPTQAERMGDFSSFAAVLLDPRTGQPFPGGMIPINRLGDPFAWRITVLSPAATPGLLLSQTGLTFYATSGGSPPPSRRLTVATLPGALNFTASVATFRGQGWLAVTPSSGTTSAAVDVQVNPAGLAPGDYYGEISIAAAGTANSPQIVTVVFNVAAPNIALAPATEPAGLLFAASPGVAPAGQFITVTNLGTTAVNFAAAATFPRAAWFT
ncbi:MAG: BACON domain-containing protein, partial [Bryobacteraceae bacterium]